MGDIWLAPVFPRKSISAFTNRDSRKRMPQKPIRQRWHRDDIQLPAKRQRTLGGEYRLVD